MSLTCRDVFFAYPKGFSLGPLNIDFRERAFNVILGPNGSGKTSLFSLIRGRNRLLRGHIAWKGKILEKGRSSVGPKQRARIMGVVPQLSERGFDFTVREMITMGGYAAGNRKSSSEVERLLGDLDLLLLADSSVRHISGGEYQRVLLGRVMYQNPEILLLDEPANHLDIRHQEHLLSSLKKLSGSGKTVIAVLHDINHALLYGDYAVVMSQGMIYNQGNPEDIITPELIKEVFETPMAYYTGPDSTRRILGPS